MDISFVKQRLDMLYQERDEALAKQDFKKAADLHFEFHRLAYAEWPLISKSLRQ